MRLFGVRAALPASSQPRTPTAVECPTLSEAKTLMVHLRDHSLERVHNLVGLELLVVGEDAGHDHDDRKHEAQVDLRAYE